MTIDAAGLDLLFREARTHNKCTDEPVSDETLRELYDILKMRPDLRQQLAGALPVLAHQGSEGAAGPGAVAGQPGQDDGGAGHRYRRLRPEILREAAEAVPAQPGRHHLVHQQRCAGRDDRVPQRHAAGRLSDHRGAGARAGYRADVGLRQRQGGRGSSLPTAAGGRISWSIWGAATGPGVFQRSPRLDFDEACVLL